VRRFRSLGFSVRIPNPHGAEAIGGSQVKEILRQAGISLDDWRNAQDSILAFLPCRRLDDRQRNTSAILVNNADIEIVFSGRCGNERKLVACLPAANIGVLSLACEALRRIRCLYHV
jgi:hypothetical protein